MNRALLTPLLLAAGLQAQTVPHVLNFTGTIQSGPDRVGQVVNFSVTLNTVTSYNNDNQAGLSWYDEGRTYTYIDGTTGQPTTGGSTYGDWVYNPAIDDYEYVVNPTALDRDLYQAITGTFLTGTWARQGADNSNDWADPYSNVGLSEAGVRVYASNDTGNGINMMFGGSQVLAMSLVFGQDPWNVDPSATPAVFTGLQYTQVYYDAFNSIVGSYGSSLATSTSTVQTTAGTYTILFTGLGVNMPAPVPEASTYGLALGALALAGAAVRRRRSA